MNHWAKILAALIVAAALIGLASAPQAGAETDLTRRLLESFTADVQAHAADGCTVTDVGINFQQVTMLAPNSAATPYFSSPGVFLQKSNWCANTLLLQASGELALDEFSISADLSAAHAVAHGTLTNLVDGSSLAVNVDVSFAPLGRTIHNGSSFKCSRTPAEPCELVASHRGGTLGGVVSDGSSNYLDANATQTTNSAQIDAWVFVNYPCFPCF